MFYFKLYIIEALHKRPCFESNLEVLIICQLHLFMNIQVF